MKRKTFGSRIFGGKRYRFSADAETKLEAKALATQRRKAGKEARVTSAKDLQGRKYYIVWVA